jgi:hypothetical protein
MKTKLFLITFISVLAGIANAQTSSGGTSTGVGVTTGTSGRTTDTGRNNSGVDANSRTATGAGVSVAPSAGIGTNAITPRVSVVDSSGQVSPVAPPVGPYGTVGNPNQPHPGVPGGQFGAAGNPNFNTNAFGANAFSNRFGVLSNRFGPLSNTFGMISNQFGIGSNVTGIGTNPLTTNGLTPTGRTNGRTRILQNNPPANPAGSSPGGGMTPPLPGSNP